MAFLEGFLNPLLKLLVRMREINEREFDDEREKGEKERGWEFNQLDPNRINWLYVGDDVFCGNFDDHRLNC